MSNFNRELNTVRGEQRVVVRWKGDDTVDVDNIRRQIIQAIDIRERRVALDLREVRGAPDALVDLLMECQAYARSRGKILVLSYATPAMQEALSGRPVRRRNPAREVNDQDQPEQGDAPDLAKSVLDQQIRREDNSHYDISKAERIDPKKKNRLQQKAKKRRIAGLAAEVLGITSLVIGIEWFVVFRDSPSALTLPVKGFEPFKETPFDAEQASLAGDVGGLRRWTDTTGRFEIVAILVEVNGESARLQREDGRFVSVKIDQLCDADRAYIRSSQLENPFVVE